MPFYTVSPGALVKSADLNQIVNVLIGTTGIPISLTGLNDQNNYVLTIQNDDATNSRGLLVQNNSGFTLLRVDKNGVALSPDGVAAATAPATLTSTQTFSNKTLDATTIINKSATLGTILFSSLGRFATGTYTGSGSDVTKTVGFTPTIVFLHNKTDNHFWFIMDTDNSCFVNPNNAIGNSTKTHITSNGFTVGGDSSGADSSNSSGDAYVWVAFAAVP